MVMLAHPDRSSFSQNQAANWRAWLEVPAFNVADRRFALHPPVTPISGDGSFNAPAGDGAAAGR